MEVGPADPDRAVVILGDEHAHRPVEAGNRVRLQELDAERRIAEQEQCRPVDRQLGAFAELRLIDLVEEANALGGDVGLDPDDGLVEAVIAALLDDAVGRRGGDRYGRIRGATIGDRMVAGPATISTARNLESSF